MNSQQVAIVTGGGQGLGQAICRRLAEAGAHVAVVDRNAETARATVHELERLTGRPALAVHADVTVEDEVAAMVAQTVAAWGRIDLLVANAGVVISGSVTELDSAGFRRVIDVNLTGYFLCAKHVVPIMKAQRHGVIIQINSISGMRGSFGNGAYCASKAAGIGLTQSLALELAEHGIRVNAICPGHLLDSPLWVNSLYKQYAARFQITEEEVRRRYIDAVPLRRPCTYEDVCNALMFLASDRADYMTGLAINVNGGQEMR
ncbi:MAG: sorbitol-6-phosphate dehydrogenase [Caldilinea sp.]|nr:sorbitol-6-phosphate dehydrogenase [Caldilinea sp.]MDW8440067.1 sorbitol-6-phosphate dehydrogenase [Caldilineaceae bacterium]